VDADTNREKVVAAIADVDAMTLASVVGGLLLLPRNLHHAHRFEALANMVAAGSAHGDREVTATALRRIHEALGEWTGMNDDPWPNLASSLTSGRKSIFFSAARWPSTSRKATAQWLTTRSFGPSSSIAATSHGGSRQVGESARARSGGRDLAC